MDRRDFLTGALAAGAGLMTFGDVFAKDASGARMKLGVLSDIHIELYDGIFLQNFEKALRKYDKWGADAVLCCGDLANLGYVNQLEAVAATWFKVFPGNRRSDGQPIVPLFHYGDHDANGDHYSKLPSEKKRFATEEARLAAILTPQNRKAVWERCFKEEWSPIMATTVKGYTFVRSHFTWGEPGNRHGDNVPGLEAFLAKLDLPKDRPFFYLQHRVPRGTACGKFLERRDDGTTTQILSKYPNCFVFCGDAHRTCTDEKVLWQGAFTCLEVPSLRYCCTEAGRENGYNSADRPPAYPFQTMPQFPSHFDRSDPLSGAHQGFFVEVGPEAIAILGWDFRNDLAMAEAPWKVPLPLDGEHPFDPARRAAGEAKPAFEKNAQISFSKVRAKDRGGDEKDFVSVEFPAALKPRANDYCVRLEMRKSDVVRVLGERRVYSRAYMWGLKKEREIPVVCLWPLEEIPEASEVRFSVTPSAAHGANGEAILTPFGKFDRKALTIR